MLFMERRKKIQLAFILNTTFQGLIFELTGSQTPSIVKERNSSQQNIYR